MTGEVAAVWNALATATMTGTSAKRNQGSHRSGSERTNVEQPSFDWAFAPAIRARRAFPYSGAPYSREAPADALQVRRLSDPPDLSPAAPAGERRSAPLRPL